MLTSENPPLQHHLALICSSASFLGASHRFWSAFLTLSALDRRGNTVFGRLIRVSDAVGHLARTWVNKVEKKAKAAPPRPLFLLGSAPQVRTPVCRLLTRLAAATY